MRYIALAPISRAQIQPTTARAIIAPPLSVSPTRSSTVVAEMPICTCGRRGRRRRTETRSARLRRGVEVHVDRHLDLVDDPVDHVVDRLAAQDRLRRELQAVR